MPKKDELINLSQEPESDICDVNGELNMDISREGRADSIGYYAMRLAMSRTIKEENDIKREWHNKGILLMAVSEVGGHSKRDFSEKFSRAILGAALNSHVIHKTAREIHALNHAAEEAKQGVIMSSAVDTNIAVKVAIVRQNGWIAVAIFGESALHPLSGHERCGMGIMHI